MLRLIKYAALPPLLNIVLILLGLVLLRRYPRLGRISLGAGVIALYLFSVPASNWLLSRGLEDHVYPLPETAIDADAIVVLGGGRESVAPQWQDQDTVSEPALARLAEAARWHRKTGLPILVSGGAADRDEESEARLMARMLEEAFGIEARWLEEDSANTRGNAYYSARILREAGISRVLLVTHAAHLTRAVPEFRHQGIEVISAPMGFTPEPWVGVAAWIPRADYLLYSARLLHEHYGIIVYTLTRDSAPTVRGN